MKKSVSLITYTLILVVFSILLFFAIPQLGPNYSTPIIYLAFSAFSLIASIVLFGVLKSTGTVNTRQYQFGGAAALFVVMLTLLVTTYKPPTPPKEIRFSGIVLLGGKPIEGAKVTLIESEKYRTTNDVGKFEFSNILPADSYRFDVSYLYIDTTFIVNRFEENELSFEISPQKIKVRGTVYEQNGKPAPFAMLDFNSGLVSDTCDAGGNYAVEMPVITDKLVHIKIHYRDKSYSQNIKITPGVLPIYLTKK